MGGESKGIDEDKERKTEETSIQHRICGFRRRSLHYRKVNFTKEGHFQTTVNNLFETLIDRIP